MIPTPPTLAGIFFCLASAEGAGLLFFPCYNTTPYKRLQWLLYHMCNLYRPCHKTAHTALQALFQRFAPFCRRIYQTDTNGYNTTCAMLEHITVLQHLQRIPKTSATPDAVQVNTAAYYNKVYIRVRPYYGSMPAGAAYRRPCQPGGVSSYRVWISGKCCTRRTC